LLYKEGPSHTKALKSGAESLGVGAEESFDYYPILDRNKPAQI